MSYEEELWQKEQMEREAKRDARRHEVLRDKFAGQAMQGIYASSFNDSRCPPFDKIAEWAYAMADAMLARRTPADREARG